MAAFPPEFPDIKTIDTDPAGMIAERDVFDAVRSAAEFIAERDRAMQFLVFHSVKYGTTGRGVAEKWESDIDIVLVCYNHRTGN